MCRPPVFTNRCCKFVSDQVATRVGSASRSHDAGIIGDYAQPKPQLVGPKAVTGKPRQRDGLLTFVDLPLGCPALVVEAHHRPAWSPKIGLDELHAGSNFPQWNSTFATTRDSAIGAEGPIRSARAYPPHWRARGSGGLPPFNYPPARASKRSAGLCTRRVFVDDFRGPAAPLRQVTFRAAATELLSPASATERTRER